MILSNTESEFLALTHTEREAITTLCLFARLCFNIDQRLVIQCDIKQAIRLVDDKNLRLHTALHYIEIHNI